MEEEKTKVAGPSGDGSRDSGQMVFVSGQVSNPYLLKRIGDVETFAQTFFEEAGDQEMVAHIDWLRDSEIEQVTSVFAGIEIEVA